MNEYNTRDENNLLLHGYDKLTVYNNASMGFILIKYFENLNQVSLLNAEHRFSLVACVSH